MLEWMIYAAVLINGDSLQYKATNHIAFPKATQCVRYLGNNAINMTYALENYLEETYGKDNYVTLEIGCMENKDPDVAENNRKVIFARRGMEDV